MNPFEQTSFEQTIIAQCTPHGPGALALLRLSGPQAVSVATKISDLPSKKTLSEQKSHTIHFGWVVDTTGRHVDQVLFFLMRGPNSFTGEDTVEITCHNNPFIIQEVIQEALAAGARLAQEGEFSRRAMMNGKIDLIQAESINELIHANTQLSLRKSLAQLEGSFSHWLAEIESQLVKTLALSEASFEFLDDEDIAFDEPIKQLLDSILATIARLKQTFNQQQQIREGIRIALIGSVNAGKSSLFNSLLGKDRAIVTNIAGTTRDVIEAGLYKDGNYWTLIDTAGLRQTEDVIEQAGIKRSYDEAEKADVIILVVDRSRVLTAQEQEVYTTLLTRFCKKIILVASKADLASIENSLLPAHEHMRICTNNQADITQLNAELRTKIGGLFSALDAPFLLNQRQYNVMVSLEHKLTQIKTMLGGAVAYELLSYELNDALCLISELTGKSVSEQAMDAVFRQFCVGK